MTIKILAESDVDQQVQAQISTLYGQLNATIEQRSLREILEEDNRVFVVVCKEGNTIIGIALLGMYKVISGQRGIVEDVVVDRAHRGRGIGRKLMEKLMEEAKKRNIDDILLFTGHHRTAAINLYKSLGFTLRKSGVYNLKLN